MNRRTFLHYSGAAATMLCLGAIPALAKEAAPAWPGVKYSKVIAYRFKGTGEHISNGFITPKGVDQAGLKSRTVKSAPLSEDQTTQLVRAIAHNGKASPGAFCYEPHHIFLFFDKHDKVVAVFEICFTCGNDEASPHLSSNMAPDYAAIEKLCKDCGIGMDDDGKAPAEGGVNKPDGDAAKKE